MILSFTFTFIFLSGGAKGRVIDSFSVIPLNHILPSLHHNPSTLLDEHHPSQKSWLDKGWELPLYMVWAVTDKLAFLEKEKKISEFPVDWVNLYHQFRIFSSVWHLGNKT